MTAFMNRLSPKVLVLIILTVVILGLLFLLPGLFFWGGSREQAEFDRQYQENLEKARQEGTSNYVDPGNAQAQ